MKGILYLSLAIVDFIIYGILINLGSVLHTVLAYLAFFFGVMMSVRFMRVNNILFKEKQIRGEENEQA